MVYKPNKLENQIQQINQQANMCSQLKLIIGRLEDFASKISHSLCQADWSMQRELIRLLVKRIEIDLNSVNVVFRIEGDFFSNDSRNNTLQHCWKRDDSALRCSFCRFFKHVLIKVSTG